jgi:hypothetical protein
MHFEGDLVLVVQLKIYLIKKAILLGADHIMYGVHLLFKLSVSEKLLALMRRDLPLDYASVFDGRHVLVSIDVRVRAIPTIELPAQFLRILIYLGPEVVFHLLYALRPRGRALPLVIHLFI